MEILKTNRLILRHFQKEDLDKIYDLVYANPQVKNTWSGVTGTPEEIKARFADRYINPGSLFGFKAMVIQGTQDLIGLMGFQPHEQAEGEEIDYLLTKESPNRRVNFDPDCLEVELTYALGQPFWKKGYALEMGRAIIPYGFSTLGIGQIIQSVMAHNENSINLMRRLGFRIEHGLQGSIVGILNKGEYFAHEQIDH